MIPLSVRPQRAEEFYRTTLPGPSRILIDAERASYDICVTWFSGCKPPGAARPSSQFCFQAAAFVTRRSGGVGHIASPPLAKGGRGDRARWCAGSPSHGFRRLAAVILPIIVLPALFPWTRRRVVLAIVGALAVEGAVNLMLSALLFQGFLIK